MKMSSVNPVVLHSSVRAPDIWEIQTSGELRRRLQEEPSKERVSV